MFLAKLIVNSFLCGVQDILWSKGVTIPYIVTPEITKQVIVQQMHAAVL